MAQSRVEAEAALRKTTYTALPDTPLTHEQSIAGTYPLLRRVKAVMIAISLLLTAALGLSAATLAYTLSVTDRMKSDRAENPVDRIISGIINETGTFFVPTRYSVPSKFLMPPSNQGQRGVCWGFGAIDQLESQYRAHGIDNGWLAADEYVRFSKQAYLKFLLDNCRDHQEIPACQHGGLGHNQTADHLVDSIYYFLKDFPQLATSIVPESVCPYQPDDSGQDDCPGLEKAIEENPVRFSIKSIEASGDIEGTKRLLVKAGRPIGVGIPIDAYRYYAPCNDSNYSSFDMCVNKTVRCPSGFSSEYCYFFDLDARIRDGTFAYIDDIERVKLLGGHAMNVVGYNDDWVYHSRKGSERGLATIRGGFIMHNSWSEPGHSVDFLMGRLSEENEAVQCPNHLSPVNWIPATAACLRNQSGNASACGTTFPRVRGKGRTTHTDVLKCTNTQYCNSSRKYALAELDGDVDAQPLFNGVDRIHLVSWTSGEDVKDEFIDYLPFFALRTIMEPANLTENAPGLCGYWMYPYDAIALVNRVEWSLLDTFHVADIVFEFTNESYARSGDVAPGKNYTLLKGSTHQYNNIVFDGPLPYDYIY